jgi:hypothetical protein
MHLFFLRELYQVGSIEEPASQAALIPSASANTESTSRPLQVALPIPHHTVRRRS